MKKVKKNHSSIPVLEELLRKGNIVCSPTDTLYGLLGHALNNKAVQKVYEIKRRTPEKPLILLFPSVEKAEEFGILIPKHLRKGILSITPERITFVVPLSENSPLREIFNREDVAFRIPKDSFLLSLLEKISPLFAPSANPQGLSPANSCEECKSYFGNKVEYCIEGRTLGTPSTIVSLIRGLPELVREGTVPFKYIKEALLEKS